MKILLYGINFAPDVTGIAKYTTEMATWLAAQGHEVRVVTAPPYYPDWRVREGYSAWRNAPETLGGVSVHRTPLWIPRSLNGFTRLLHLLSFAIGSVPKLLQQTLWRPQLVWVVAPAFASAPMGLLAARLCGARAWLHFQDFEIDAAFKLGLLRGRWVERAARAVERWVVSRFDRVSTISERMFSLLPGKGVETRKAVLFPNWVDVDTIRPNGSPGNYRRELGLPEDAVVALYSGSMAAKQGLELIPAAARLVEKSEPRLHFVVCGDGVCKPQIQQLARDLGNVHFLPLQPLARLDELLRTADIHLLPQQGDAADLVMPSKLTGMLSSGRPVLATAETVTEIGRVVQGRGIVVPPGDLPAFVSALIELGRDDELRTQLGRAARSYAEECLAREQVLGRFNDEMLGLIDGRHTLHNRPLAPAKATD